MKHPFTTTILITLLVLQGCSVNKKYGNYINPWRFWTPMITLNADSSFSYIAINNSGVAYDTSKIDYGILIRQKNFQTCYDSTYGRYALNRDTVSFMYHTDTLPGKNGCYSDRPGRMLWKGNKLYIVYALGQVWKRKEHYFKWTKGKAAILFDTSLRKSLAPIP